MTIAQAFNEIAVAQGGTASKSGTIAGAIDALNDALAGSDQASAQTIEDAVRLLGQNIGGGSSVTVEALTATENKTYTAPSGKAYSPVTVNVSGGGTHAVACKLLDTGTNTFTDMESLVTQTEVSSRGRYVPIGAYITSATAGDVLCANADKSGVGSLFMYGTADSESVVISIGDFNGDDACFVMPDSDVVVVYTS